MAPWSSDYITKELDCWSHHLCWGEDKISEWLFFLSARDHVIKCLGFDYVTTLEQDISPDNTIHQHKTVINSVNVLLDSRSALGHSFFSFFYLLFPLEGKPSGYSDPGTYVEIILIDFDKLICFQKLIASFLQEFPWQPPFCMIFVLVIFFYFYNLQFLGRAGGSEGQFCHIIIYKYISFFQFLLQITKIICLYS